MKPPSPEFTANVVGAFVMALSDQVRDLAAGGRTDATAAAALVHLSKYPDESIDTLRVPLRLSHSGCVRLVDRLEELGYVKRGTGEDARKVALQLTARGSRVAAAVLDARRDALLGAVETLSADERKTLAQLLSKVLHPYVRDLPHALSICRYCDYQDCPKDLCPVGNSAALQSQ